VVAVVSEISNNKCKWRGHALSLVDFVTSLCVVDKHSIKTILYAAIFTVLAWTPGKKFM
jgi:hypothetical protein